MLRCVRGFLFRRSIGARPAVCAGTMRATGRPRRVTRISAPASTSRKIRENC